MQRARVRHRPHRGVVDARDRDQHDVTLGSGSSARPPRSSSTPARTGRRSRRRPARTATNPSAGAPAAARRNWNHRFAVSDLGDRPRSPCRLRAWSRSRPRSAPDRTDEMLVRPVQPAQLAQPGGATPATAAGRSGSRLGGPTNHGSRPLGPDRPQVADRLQGRRPQVDGQARRTWSPRPRRAESRRAGALAADRRSGGAPTGRTHDDRDRDDHDPCAAA